jgi:tetraacyldisaccharide 4'-kinase
MPVASSSPVPLPAAVAGPLSAIYASAARWRRRRLSRAARRLRAPVISVGALAAGGSGKTPLAAYVAGLLRDAGERPAILSRGYGREHDEDGVVVVSDGTSLRADLARSGDEPLLLARAVPGVPVLVCPDRYLAGCLAESRLGCTVHVLDDGFQHHALRRDVDLVVASGDDVRHGRVLPAGRLREPLDVLQLLPETSAVLAPAPDVHDVTAVAAALGVRHVFGVARTVGVPRLVEPWGHPPRVPRSAAVMAVAAIARPAGFLAELAGQGWNVVAHRVFPDHHRYSRDDVDRIDGDARTAGAALILTTEKDIMRLLPWRPLPFPTAWVPMKVEVAPAGAFAGWLLAALRRARDVRTGGPAVVPAVPPLRVPPPGVALTQ